MSQEFTNHTKVAAKEGFFVGARGNEIGVINKDRAFTLGDTTIETTDRIKKVAKVALGAADTGGGVLSWQNPEGEAIIITRVLIDVTTKATAACTIDVGTTATNGTTSSDNLVDGADIHTAVGVFDNIDNAGTNGKSKQKLAADKWVTGSRASGAAAGTVGFAYIEYVII